jgi:hypothetical protein
MTRTQDLALTGLVAIVAVGYVFERKRQCIIHKKSACTIEAVLDGRSAEGCEQEAKQFCKIFGVL